MKPSYQRTFFPFITILILVAIFVARETQKRVDVLTKRLGTLASLSFQNMEYEEETQDTDKPQVYILYFLQRV